MNDLSRWIGPKTIATMKSMAGELLDDYEGKMNLAFLKTGDEGKLKVGLSFDISLSGTVQNAVDVDATITFTADKVKDKIEKVGVSEIQGGLFDGATVTFPDGVKGKYKVAGE